MESKRRQSEDEIKVRELQARLKSAGEVQARLQLAKVEQSGELVGDSSQQSADPVVDMEEEGKADATDASSSSSRLSDREAKLIGMQMLIYTSNYMEAEILSEFCPLGCNAVYCVFWRKALTSMKQVASLCHTALCFYPGDCGHIFLRLLL
jgi:hypothetical protein